MTSKITTNGSAVDTHPTALFPGVNGLESPPAVEEPLPIFADEDPVELPLVPLPTRAAAAVGLGVLAFAALSAAWTAFQPGGG